MRHDSWAHAGKGGTSRPAPTERRSPGDPDLRPHHPSHRQLLRPSARHRRGRTEASPRRPSRRTRSCSPSRVDVTLAMDVLLARSTRAAALAVLPANPTQEYRAAGQTFKEATAPQEELAGLDMLATLQAWTTERPERL